MGVSCSSAAQDEDLANNLKNGQRRSFGDDDGWKNRAGGVPPEKKKKVKRRRFGTMPARRSRSAGAIKARDDPKDASKVSRETYQDFISTLAAKRPRAPSIHSPRPDVNSRPRTKPPPRSNVSSAKLPQKQRASVAAGRERAFSDGGLDMTATHTIPVSRSRTPSLSSNDGIAIGADESMSPSMSRSRCRQRRRQSLSKSKSLSRASSAHTMRATPPPKPKKPKVVLPTSPSRGGLSSPAIVFSSPGKAKHGGPNTIVHHILNDESDSESEPEELMLATLSRRDTRFGGASSTSHAHAENDVAYPASSSSDSDIEDAHKLLRAPSRSYGASSVSSVALASPDFHASLPPPPHTHPDEDDEITVGGGDGAMMKMCRARSSLTAALNAAAMSDDTIRPVSAFGPHTANPPTLTHASPRAMTPVAHTFSPHARPHPHCSNPTTPKAITLVSPLAMSPMQLDNAHTYASHSRRTSLSRASHANESAHSHSGGGGFYIAHDPSRFTTRRASQHALQVARMNTRTRTPSLPDPEMHQIQRPQSVAERVRSKSVNLRALQASNQVPHAYAPHANQFHQSTYAHAHAHVHSGSLVPLTTPHHNSASVSTASRPTTPKSEFGGSGADSAYDTEPTTDEEDNGDVAGADEAELSDAEEAVAVPNSNTYVHRPTMGSGGASPRYAHAADLSRTNDDHSSHDDPALYDPNVYVNEVKRQQKMASRGGRLYSQSTVYARHGANTTGYGHHHGGDVESNRSPSRPRMLSSPSLKIANQAKGALQSPQKAHAVDNMASIFQETLSPPASSPRNTRDRSNASPAPASPLMSSKRKVVAAEEQIEVKTSDKVSLARQPSFKLRVVSTRKDASGTSGTPEFMQVRKSIITRRQSDPNLAKAQLRAERERTLNDFSHRRNLGVAGSPTPSADSPPMMAAPAPASVQVPYKRRGVRHLPTTMAQHIDDDLAAAGATPERISRTIDRSASTRPSCASLSPPSRKMLPAGHAHPSQFNKPPRRPPRPGSRSVVAPARRAPQAKGSYHSGQIVTMPDGSKAIMTGSRSQSLRRPKKPVKPAKPQKVPTMPAKPSAAAWSPPAVPTKPSKPARACSAGNMVPTKPVVSTKPAGKRPSMPAKVPTRPRQAPAKPSKPMMKPAFGAPSKPSKPALPRRHRERSFKEEDFERARRFSPRALHA